MHSYVKIYFISIFSHFPVFLITILTYSLSLPESQLETQQLMTSQIR